MVQKKQDSEDLQAHLRSALAQRRDQIIGGQEDEEWDNPIAREDRAQAVIARRREERGAELEQVGAQQVVTKRLREEQGAQEFLARRREERGAELEQLGAQQVVTKGRNRRTVEHLRGEQQDADAPFTLHANQGMAAVGPLLAELRQALLRYIRAIRAKEALRSEYGVSKLRKISRSQKKKHPDLKGRIEAVRTEKTEAKAAFEDLRKRVDDFLTDPAWQQPDVMAEISRLDREIANVSDDEIDARVAHEAEQVEQRSGEVDKLGKLATTLALSEAKYNTLLRDVKALTDAGVGSKEFSFKFSVSGSFLGFMSAGGGITSSGKTDIQDDRRLRVTRTWGAFGNIKAELASVLAADAELGYGRSTTEVFIDAEHWAADMAFRASRIQTLLRQFRGEQAFDPRGAAEELYGAEDSNELMATKSIAEHDNVTDVTAHSISAGVSGNVLGYGASYGYNRKWMTFEKPGADGARLRRQARQSSHSFQLSAGNLSASFTRTWIDNHANPDNDGTYWNIKLALSGKASAQLEGVGDSAKEAWLQNLEADLLDRLNATEASSSSGFSASSAEQQLYEGSKAAIDGGKGGDLAKAFASYLDQALVSLEASFEVDNPFSVSLTGTRELAVEWNALWNPKSAARIQYRRFSGGKGMEASGSVNLGAVPVSVGIGAKRGQSTMISEKLGANTATYLQTVFDGLRLRDKRDADLGRSREALAQWNAYVGTHKREIWAMLRNLAGGSSKVFGEIDEQKTDAEAIAADRPDAAVQATAVADAAGALLAACSGHGDALGQSEVDADIFAELTGLLTAYFANLAQLTAIVEASRWERV